MIHVYSRANFKQLTPSNDAVISIWSTNPYPDEFQYTDLDLLNSWETSLQVNFDDMSKLLEPYTLFNWYHAETIIKFALSNQAKNFIIHCDAGISRSTAVARFLQELLNKEVIYHETGFQKDKLRNSFVFSTLNRYIKFKDKTKDIGSS